MDKRLELTKEQKELTKKFNELCEEMSRSGIGLVLHGDDVSFINLEKVDDWVAVEDMATDDYDEEVEEELVDIEEMPLSGIKFFYETGCPDDFVGIRFK